MPDRLHRPRNITMQYEKNPTLHRAAIAPTFANSVVDTITGRHRVDQFRVDQCIKRLLAVINHSSRRTFSYLLTPRRDGLQGR